MKRLFILLLLLLGSARLASANDSVKGWCEEGNRPVTTSGLTSTTRVQASHPSCTITVYIHGGGLATIYADNNLTPLANPFTAQSGGRWQAYAQNGRYDVTMNSAGFSQTVTYSDIILCDPFTVGSTCNNGGATTAHNLLSTTHLDTIPASPPVRGDLVTAQNQTSPTGVNPSWARLAIGTNGQVLTSNGVDALWATPAGGAGCTLTGVDKGVVSEHPLGTCFDSIKYTWDATKEVLLAGDGSTTVTSDVSEVYNLGTANVIKDIALTGLVIGDANNLWGVSNVSVSSELYIIGDGNNNQRNSGEAYIVGVGNRIRDTTFDHFIFGVGNRFESATPGTAVNMDHGFAVGGSNIATAAPGSSTSDIGFTGYSNTITVTNSKSLTNSFLYGIANSAVINTTSNDHDLYAFGGRNTFEDTLNLTEQAMSLGFNNDINGANSTAQTLGIFNILHNVSINNGNTVIVGSQNAATNLGALAGLTYQDTYGHQTNLHDCSDCIAIGANVNESTDHTMGIGMSSAPEIVVIAGHVALAAHLDQTAAGTFGNKCSMSASTTCTFSIAAAFTGTPLCVTSIDAASAVPGTANVAKCSVSGTTVTITAGSSNSLTWDAILIGNPN